jgi:hypothetical protein
MSLLILKSVNLLRPTPTNHDDAAPKISGKEVDKLLRMASVFKKLYSVAIIECCSNTKGSYIYIFTYQ